LKKNGISLYGIAGAEMRNLYSAIQYYQFVLDRFYENSKKINQSIQLENEGFQASFITAETVSSYFGRLIRASTQKSKVWAEIAQRYQNFNRPDLAREVVERSYTATYVESLIFTQLLQEIVEITEPEKITQVRNQVDFAQRSYRVALSLMSEHYENISDDLNYFGYAPDYIPFPALEEFRDNPVEVGLFRANTRVSLALQAEQTALDSDRAFNTDQANFQNELTRIENTYDAQLSEICGTFEAEGQIYPATTKYAYLSDDTRQVGDPCGLVGTGQIHSTFGQIDILQTELKRVRQSMMNTLEEARIEESRWDLSCGISNAFNAYQYQTANRTNRIQYNIEVARNMLGSIDRVLSDISTVAQLSKCSIILGTSTGGDCASVPIALTLYKGGVIAANLTRIGTEAEIANSESLIRELQADVEFRRGEMQCALVQIDGQARVRSILLRLSELKLEALKVEYEINQVLSSIRQFKHQAICL
jgi:hypothetical protein